MMPARERPCACGRGPHEDHGKWNGVRSYLHLFYEDCGGAAHPEEVEDPTPNNQDTCDWSSSFWKGVVSLSLLLLLLGAAALTTGYAVPPKLEGIGAGEFLVLDQRAAQYNKALGTCRLAGSALCAVAAILLSTCMLLVLLTRLKPEPKAEPADREDEEAQQRAPILCQRPQSCLEPGSHELTLPLKNCVILEEETEDQAEEETFLSQRESVAEVENRPRSPDSHSSAISNELAPRGGELGFLDGDMSVSLEEIDVSMLCPPKPVSQVSPSWVQQQEVSFLPSPPGGNLCPGLA
ncbi:neurensin-2 [Trichosurus vulpecula]|uniref:neurensin-2 n=1 Tax=Trichosurus vulpecula TaxID=9337 RepID=UPI00186B2A40|nr:neurensin-2 [Trichosurus vulpecula]